MLLKNADIAVIMKDGLGISEGKIRQLCLHGLCLLNPGVRDEYDDKNYDGLIVR
jgi:hypothetical protein